MKPLSILFVAFAFVLSGCVTGDDGATGSLDAAHNSRNSLDWAGTYEGVLPCADCPGITVRLVLREDGSYAVTRRYIGRSVDQSIERGTFTWLPGGNAIKLESKAGAIRFAVGEGRLALLEPGGAAAWPQPAPHVLALVTQTAARARDVQGTLEAHRWVLDRASDASGRPIAGLGADRVRPIVFRFNAGRLGVEGGCNRSFGAYRIDAEGHLVVSRLASTMMACEQALMRVDDELATLLAQPARIELTQGAEPILSLASATAGMLRFSGHLTPEARYGTPTRVFVEVAPQKVACSTSTGTRASCLQVREIRFDDKGLRVGAPGAWHSMQESIEGYSHEVGVRKVLRLKRFQDPAGGPIYVLDMVVESDGSVRWDGAPRPKPWRALALLVRDDMTPERHSVI